MAPVGAAPITMLAGVISFGGSVTFDTDDTGTSVRIDFPPTLVSNAT